MEFKFYQKELELQSRGWIPTFHDISKEIIEIVKASGVKNGTVAIASHHTTCLVMVQECSHDIDSFDLEYLQHDLLDIMRKMIPDHTNEGDYRHPGPINAKFGRFVGEPGDFTSMNTDGHLRSVFFGRSEVMTIKDGELDGGDRNVWAISPEGFYIGTVPTVYKDGKLKFTVGNTSQSMYYLIVKE